MTAERVEAAPQSIPALPGAPATLLILPANRGADGYARYGKRALDLVLSVAALIILAPVLLLVGAVVALSMGRPVLFRQARVGHGGTIFTVLKFRTMRPDRRTDTPGAWDGVDRRLTHKTTHDPRHTAVGRVLRMLSLDELPQLCNVVRGDMSVVGPRPELVHVVDRYQPWQHVRHQVRPGLTGLWQVSSRGSTPMHEATHLDLRYIAQLSLATDLTILLKTPAAVLKRTGH